MKQTDISKLTINTVSSQKLYDELDKKANQFYLVEDEIDNFTVPTVVVNEDGVGSIVNKKVDTYTQEQIDSMIDSCVAYKQALTAGTDLNSVIDSGYYIKDKQIDVINGVNSNLAKIICFNYGFIENENLAAVQLWIDCTDQRLYYRCNDGQEWSNWQKVLDERDTQAQLDTLMSVINSIFKQNTETDQWIASFITDLENIPTNNLILSILPRQGGEGYPRPDNIQKVTGYTGASIFNSGKNMLRNMQPEGIITRTLPDITFQIETYKNGSFKIFSSGTSTSTSQIVYNLNPLTNYPSSTGNRIPLINAPDVFVLKQGVRYFIQDCNITIVKDMNDVSDNSVKTINGNGVSVLNNHTYTTFTPEVDYHVKEVRVFITPSSGSNPDFIYEPILCELPDGTNTEFVPYSGTEEAVSWRNEVISAGIDNDGQVYKGQLDLTTGKLTISHIKVSVLPNQSLASSTMNSQENYKNYIFGIANTLDTFGTAESSAVIEDLYSNTFTAVSSNDALSNENECFGIYLYYGINVQSTLRFCLPRTFLNTYEGSSVRAKCLTWLNEWIENHGELYIIAKLVNPITIQLSPKQVMSFINENNLWTNVGKILNVVYYTKKDNVSTDTESLINRIQVLEEKLEALQTNN